GIVGIVNTDGSPVDRDLLVRLTDSLAFRGPDRRDVWIDGAVGLGHAQLCTTREQATEQQPFTVDGTTCITADVRLDGRAELAQRLDPGGKRLKGAPDVELLLHTYLAWGEQCLRQLIGDFAFAIWDGPRKRLFCGRDQLGVKPFYYAHMKNSFVFSNTLQCLVTCPGVSHELNDLAVADFLLFEANQDPTTTTFAAINRLPAAHELICNGRSVQTRRYWRLASDGHVEYGDRRDYVERFRELFGVAVRDRLRADSVGAFMSGGMDSTSIVATACAARSSGSPEAPVTITAQCVYYDRLFDDQEPRFARIVAEHFDLPVQWLKADDYALFDGGATVGWRTPEPMHDPTPAICRASYAQIAQASRVVLHGVGGDPLFMPSPRYVLDSLRALRLDRLTAPALWLLRSRRKLPRIGLRGALRQALGVKPLCYGYPGWLDPDLEASLKLRERWENVYGGRPIEHSTHPEAYASLTGQFWQNWFEREDAGFIGVAIEERFPFFDVRLLEYVLSIPPLPWCIEKELLRSAMRGLLPEAVRMRPKAPLGGVPYVALLAQPEARWLDRAMLSDTTRRYVRADLVPPATVSPHPMESWVNLRPFSFDNWLAGLRP
ncbi:MAG: asparagine synthase, partial [Chloroflexi bacterium]|nr:asparagine synthase [Chloroflexota bacterium]